ncbi:MAG: ATP-dependent endonuclease [Acidobacteriia bacterium]|nr:ATP-dependent endonuclease [Terriglobia bacterium]
MKIRWVQIKNFRSCEELKINFGSMHALVGANNAGKSAILRALDFFFNPAMGKLSDETFWNGDTKRGIWIEILFDSLSAQEKEALGPYLRRDGTFHVARSAVLKDRDESDDDTKFTISQHYCIPAPKLEWLRASDVTGDKINVWWAAKESLTVNGISFAAFVGGPKPGVGVWKTKAGEFAQQHLTDADFEDSWADNPKGYAGVLKGNLPHFILVPAVRDLSEEAKATKSNPFGKLLYAIVESVTEGQRSELDVALGNLKSRLNREGGGGRLEGIVRTETRLNEILREYMPCDLEIEFQAPTLEVLLTTPKLYADDGFRNTADNKGHGLQRAIIFSILRCYAERLTGTGDEKKRTLVFAVEEPETYMHPQAQRTIRRVFLELARRGDQVLFSTHSSLLLDVAYFDELVRVEALHTAVDKKTEVRSKVWQLAIKDLVEDLAARHPGATPSADSIRDLYMNAYHPTRSEGFFARKVVLVEGPTEQYALPIYAEARGYRLDELNISVVDCGGKGQMDRLYRIFNELGMACYMVFDYDKNSDEKSTIEKSRELLTLAGEPSEPPAALFIGKKAACFPTKWEEHLRSETPDMEELTAAARKSMGLRDDTGKPLVARYIARQLTSRNPAVVPESIRLILEKAVTVEWRGSCLTHRAPETPVTPEVPPVASGPAAAVNAAVKET